jgi:hypothetical protein
VISQHSIAKLMLLAALSCLMGCAVVDQYSGRAVVYNVEAEQAQEQALLLNVARAYLRHPMQFTSVSTITGSASASGGVQYTLPVNVPFRPVTNGSSIAAFPALPTWTLNGGMSGGPTFTVPVLDTQEFYDGIMKPITGQMYDLYIQGDYPRDLLFNLFVSKVTMTLASCVDTAPSSPAGTKHKRSVPPADCEFVFHNTVGDEIELQLFQALADYLIALGLATEPSPSSKNDFFYQDWKNPKLVGFEVKLSGSSPSGGLNDSGSSGASSVSDAQAKSYSFCFSPPDSTVGSVPDPDYWCKIVRKQEDSDDRPLKRGATSPSAQELKRERELATAENNEQIKPTGTATGKVTASAEFIFRLMKIAQDSTINQRSRNVYQALARFSGQDIYLSFNLRSVEAMIYYLGEIARRELNPEFDQPKRIVYVRTVPHYATYSANEPCTPLDSDCAPLFVLNRNSVPHIDDFLTVTYDDARYTVPGKTGNGGWSSAVLEIVKQQLALNSSAKSLPQSNVVSLVGQ